MLEQSKTELFERAPVPRAVATLAVPTILSSLVMVLYNLADTYFVGMLNNPVQNAAVTLAAPVLLAFNAVNNLFGVGASSMMSRGLGRKDFETVRKSSALGFYCAVVCGLVFSVLFTALRDKAVYLLGADSETYGATSAYLKWTVTFGAAPAILNVVMAYLVRAEGSSLHASIGTMSGCLLNIALDPVFIMPWGLGMGAAGAGFATFLSNCVACCYFFVLLAVRRGKTYVSIDPRALGASWKILGGICAVGVPAAIQNLLNVTGMTVLNNFAAAFGADAIAAMGIAQKIDQVPFYIAHGLSLGVMPLVGYTYANGDVARMKKTLQFALKLTLGFLLTICALYLIFAPQLITAFMKNETIVAYGTRILRGLCLALPFIGIDFMAVGVFQACGFGQKALLFAVLRKIVLEIPALVVLNHFVPFYGLAYAQLTAEVVLAAAALWELRKILRKITAQTKRVAP